jgi:hypothetical protein
MIMAAMSPSEESLKLIVCAQDNVSEWNGEEVSLATRITNAVHGGAGSQLTGAWRLRQLIYRPTAQATHTRVDCSPCGGTWATEY